MGATPGDVDVLVSDPDCDGAATPEANKPVQSQTIVASGNPRTVAPAVLTMMVMILLPELLASCLHLPEAPFSAVVEKLRGSLTTVLP